MLKILTIFKNTKKIKEKCKNQEKKIANKNGRNSIKKTVKKSRIKKKKKLNCA